MAKIFTNLGFNWKTEPNGDKIFCFKDYELMRVVNVSCKQICEHESTQRTN